MVRWCSGYHIVLIDESSCSSYARVLGSSPSRTIIYAFLFWFFSALGRATDYMFLDRRHFCRWRENGGGIRCLGMGTDGGRRGVDHSISSSAWANPTITTSTCPSKPFLDPTKTPKRSRRPENKNAPKHSRLRPLHPRCTRSLPSSSASKPTTSPPTSGTPRYPPIPSPHHLTT